MRLKLINTLCLLFGLLMFSGAGWALSACPNTYPAVKQITIINNTAQDGTAGVTIYPVIEASIHGQDDWLRAFNCISKNDATNLYQTKYLYRAYIGGDPAGANSGIKPGTQGNPGKMTINVPFYSTLVPSPTGNGVDDYIDWWNGVRVDIYDNQAAAEAAYKKDQTSGTVTPLTHPLTCEGVNCSLSAVFHNINGLPSNDPLQLTEYTFGGVNPNTPGNDPFGWDENATDVDYDVSYVDDVYLPVAIEPVHPADQNIGYTGSARRLLDFRSRVDQFINDSSLDGGWAKYLNSLYPSLVRVPAAYPIIAYGSPVPPEMDPKNIQKDFIANWTTYVNNNGGANNVIQHLFMRNYADFVTQCTAKGFNEPATPDAHDLAAHVYGFVAFVDCNKVAPVTTIINPLATSSTDTLFHDAEKAYKALQYDNTPIGSGLSFNPFVQFIHGGGSNPKPYDLGIIGSYAFSIDDIVGNMLEPGEGLYIAVGGHEGLPNPNGYDPSKMVTVTMGAPILGIHYTSYYVCTDTPNSPACTSPSDDVFKPLLLGSLTFKIETPNSPDGPPNKAHPYTVLLKDNNAPAHTYKFELIQAAPFGPINKRPLPPTDQVQCAVSGGWCSNVNAAVNGEKGSASRSMLSTPSPLDVNVVNLSLGTPTGNQPQWQKYTTCNQQTETPILSGVTQIPVGNINGKIPCQIHLWDSNNGEYSFSIKHAAPFVPSEMNQANVGKYIDCQGNAWCENYGVHPSVDNDSETHNSFVNTPPPTGGVVNPIVVSIKAEREDVVKDNVDVTVGKPTGGNGTYNPYTYYGCTSSPSLPIPRTPPAGCTEWTTFGTPVPPVTQVLKGFYQDQSYVYAQVTDTNNDFGNSNVVTIPPSGGVPIFGIPEITSANRVTPSSSDVRVLYNPATGGGAYTDQYYACTSPTVCTTPSFTKNGTGDVTLHNVSLDAVTVYVTATRDSHTSRSNIVSVPAAAGTITVNIPYYQWYDSATLALSYPIATSGGVPPYTYTYEIDGNPVSYKVMGGILYLRKIDGTKPHKITVIAKDSKGNSGSGSINTNPYPN